MMRYSFRIPPSTENHRGKVVITMRHVSGWAESARIRRQNRQRVDKREHVNRPTFNTWCATEGARLEVVAPPARDDAG